MSRERVSTPDIDTEEKRKKALRDTVRQLRAFHKKILKSRGGKPLPDSLADLVEIREGR